MAEGVDGACVNIGGDLRVLGESPDGLRLDAGHRASVLDDPDRAGRLAAGAIATSSVLRRVWTRDGRTRHHLIDPATGEPSQSDLGLASVGAGEAWTAEVLAKAALLRGRSRAFDLLDASTAALVVDHEGRVTATDSMSAFVGAQPLPTAIEFDLHEELQ
jgi:thiamine biosynthesis lipoprotein